MPTQGVVNIGRAQHKWSDQDRTLVAVLDRCYIMTRSDQQQIFNVICKETLKREGYDSDSYSGVNAQMKELKAGGKGFRFWRIVMELPAASVMAIFSDERKSIEEAAGQVGVVLELSSEFDEFVSQAKAPAMKERISGSVQVAQATLQLPKSDIMAEVSVKSTALSNPRRIFIGVEIPMTHKAGRNKLPRREIISASPPRREENILDILRRVRLSPKLRSNKDFEGNFSIGGHPTILFRAFEPEHRFRARRFLASDTDIPTPPHVGSLKFLNEVERHLRVDKTYASPVISVTEHARNALRKIATEKPARSLAIFDYFEVEEDLVERYGTRCRPYLVPNICDKHGLHGDRELPKGYRGRGEVRCLACVAVGGLTIRSGSSGATFNANQSRSLTRMKHSNFASGSRACSRLTRSLTKTVAA